MKIVLHLTFKESFSCSKNPVSELKLELYDDWQWNEENRRFREVHTSRIKLLHKCRFRVLDGVGGVFYRISAESGYYSE